MAVKVFCAICGGVIKAFGSTRADSHGMIVIDGVLRPVHHECVYGREKLHGPEQP
jgi:hypothetical protein